MPRFFITELLNEKEYDNIPIDGRREIYISKDENARHILRSLRMRIGEEITLSDGAGWDFQGKIMRLDSDGVLIELLNRKKNDTEPQTRVSVYQCLPKSDKLENVAQKITELGAYELISVVSERCVVKLDEKAAEKKTARLQKIVAEAAKQSGRGKIPRVHSPIPLKEALERAVRAGTVLFFYEGGGTDIKSALKASENQISIIIGPEGGFAHEEAALAEACGARTVTLGKRILRTETAPLAALSIIMYEKGEMR